MARAAKSLIEVQGSDRHGYFGAVHFAFGTELARWDHDGRYLDGGPWYDGRLDIEPRRYTPPTAISAPEE